MLATMYAEAAQLVPSFPAKWRWARSKRWEFAQLEDPEAEAVRHEDCPAVSGGALIEFCGDYRIGNGTENAARSGREAAKRLLERTAAADVQQ